MIRIRKAIARDAERIAACLLPAMEDIIFQFIGAKDPVRALGFLKHFAAREQNQYSWQNCRVAVLDQEVVAAAAVYEGGRLIPLRQPVLDYLRSRNPAFRQPEAETGPGEYYIDSIGVLPAYRGRGTGEALLQALIGEYVIGGGQTLGLLADRTNLPAQRLYRKLGFVPVGVKFLMGKELEHLQLRPEPGRNPGS